MRKAVLLYNPLSGNHHDGRRKIIDAISATIRSANVEIYSEPTVSGPQTRGQVSAAIQQGCDTILAAGGDGTIHDVLQGLANTPAALGVIPLGTANTLAHDLRLPLSPVPAARALLQAEPRRIPLGLVEFTSFAGSAAARYFTVAVGIGVDAHLFYRLNPGHKLRLGMAAYYAKATHLWLTDPLHYFPVKVLGAGDAESEEVQASQLLAVRIRYFGGVLRELAPGASLQVPHLRLVLFRTRSRLRYLAYITRGLVGARWRIPGIEVLDALAVECPVRPVQGKPSSPRVFVEADGELLGTIPAKIKVVPDALTLLTPP
jgi:diacylglycerol kinase family enzyme